MSRRSACAGGLPGLEQQKRGPRRHIETRQSGASSDSAWCTPSLVRSQTDQNAVILWGSKPNHVLHLILTLVTTGFWVFIWIIVALAVKETRTLIAALPRMECS